MGIEHTRAWRYASLKLMGKLRVQEALLQVIKCIFAGNQSFGAVIYADEHGDRPV